MEKPFIRIGNDVIAVAHIAAIEHIEDRYCVFILGQNVPLVYPNGTPEALALIEWLDSSRVETLLAPMCATPRDDLG